MTKRASASVFAAMCAAIGVGVIAAQTEMKQEVIESKSQASRGAEDPNIKSSTRVNDPKVETPAPPSKGGEKPRGQLQTCVVHLDNRTPWYVHVYVDGNYSGLLPPWGDLYDRAIAGPTVVYARANFLDGTWRYWGPQKFSCPAGTQQTWRVYR